MSQSQVNWSTATACTLTSYLSLFVLGFHAEEPSSPYGCFVQNDPTTKKRTLRFNHKKTLGKYDPTTRAICTNVCEAVRVMGSNIHGEAMGLYRLEPNDNADDFKRLPLARPHYTFTNNNSVKFCLAYHDDMPWVLDGGSHRWAITRSSHSRNCTLPLVTLMGNPGDYKDILLFNKNQYSTPIQSRREDWTAFVFETFAVQVSAQHRVWH
jgi:hypothetical protein